MKYLCCDINAKENAYITYALLILMYLCTHLHTQRDAYRDKKREKKYIAIEIGL